MAEEAHPIQVDLEKILPLLAKEIYNTAYAFLRENVQNAVDAVRIQVYRERTSGRPPSDHSIRIVIDGKTTSISDTGIGMSRGDLRTYYWSIGQSGKHTEEAKAAGVVGTFGIGGMANFGASSRIKIVTRTEESREAVVCEAERAKLSASRKCVFYSVGPPNAPRGSTVIAELVDAIDPSAAVTYLEQIVQYVEIPIYVNEKLLSQKSFARIRRDSGESVSVDEGGLCLTVFVSADARGRAEAEIEKMYWRGSELERVRGYFRVGSGAVVAYQHGFMLARVPVTATFSLGGDLDCPLLRPTAGREAVTDETQRLVQLCVANVERAIAEYIARRPELADRFSSFFHYIAARGRWELGELATVRVYGSDSRPTLGSIRDTSKHTGVYFCQEKHDRSIMETYKSQGKMIIQLSSEHWRQQVERQYLTSFCSAKVLEDRVTCTKTIDDSKLDPVDFSFLLGLKYKLKFQFFVENISVKAGELTHQAMLWSPPKKAGVGMILFVDMRHPNVKRLIGAHQSLGYDAFFDMFVRDNVFPHLEGAFPELRKRDFDTLLKRLQSRIESYQIDPQDIERLKLLAEATHMPAETIAQAMGARRFGTPLPASVTKAEVVSVSQVVSTPEVSVEPGPEADRQREEFFATFLGTDIKAKIIDTTGVPDGFGVRGYYMAITPDAHAFYRWALERHPSIDFIWGGNRTGYLFYAEGSSILYYDIELRTLVEPRLVDGTYQRVGTLHLDRDALLCRNMVFLPIPAGFEDYFVPQKEPLRFTIRHEIKGLADLTAPNAAP